MRRVFFFVATMIFVASTANAAASHDSVDPVVQSLSPGRLLRARLSGKRLVDVDGMVARSNGRMLDGSGGGSG